jgi:superfamily I DNA/RNA helicase/Zn-dependent peptidase ImmA (M78 family)
MNPFQRAQAASMEIREQLLNERADLPITARELLALLEERLNLGIESVNKNSPELENGDACLRRDEQFIYVRKDVSQDEHAELVAHELGHWKLDADKTQATVASLAALSNIKGSPGVIKVEAYGSRERQELQANVFGREFLLPRHVARQLFIDGVGPNKVATDLGIPVTIVQQQMVDAILLPVIDNPPLQNLHEPSADQMQAAQAKECFVNVVAGPGTGKTSTLIHRVKFLIEELNIDPSHILVLTFTNKAANELVERLRVAGINRAADIWAGTFHAFGLEFLRKYHDFFGLKSEVVVADKLNILTMLNRELPNLALQYFLRIEDPYEWLGPVVQAIKRLKEELVTPLQYRQRIKKLDCDDDELQLIRQDVATLYEAHERILHENGFIDFVDLVALPAISIRDDRARFSELADKFQYILVDEYQDVTEVMVELVRQLAHKAKSLWVVGDVRQAIHHWRGASVKSLIQFENTFAEQATSTNSLIQKYSLEFNRRSSQEIVDLVKKAGEIHILQQQLPLAKITASDGACGQKPILVSCSSSATIPEAIVSHIKELESKGIPYSQQGVLCRKSANVEYVAHQLHDQGVPVFYIGELSHRPEIKKFLCLMQLLTERQPKALIGLMGTNSVNIPFDDIVKMIEYANHDMEWQRGRWIKSSFNEVSDDARAGMNVLKKLLDKHNRYSSPWNFLCDLLLEKRFGLPSLDDNSIDAQVARIALWQFFYSAQSGDGDGKRQTLVRYLLRLQLRQRIGETYSDRELPHEATTLNAVHVQTVHGSKGLEYDAVHIGYVEKDTYGKDEPWSPPGYNIVDFVPPEVLGSSIEEYKFEQAVERNNLFYVAMSRAKQHLILYEVGGQWANSNRPAQLKADPSLFIMKSIDSVVEKAKKSSLAEQRQMSDEVLSFNQFQTYISCPLQYRYRFVLNLAREQDTDISVRAQFSVMNALKAIASGVTSEKIAAFETAWFENNLPNKIEDPALWKDAVIAFENGLKLLHDNKGTFEEPETSIAGVPISFPWVMTQRHNSKTIFHLIRFSPRSASKSISLLRPMLSGLSQDENVVVNISSLLSTATHSATPSARIESTNAMASAKKFLLGDCSPSKGYHCKFCPYISICPVSPV